MPLNRSKSEKSRQHHAAGIFHVQKERGWCYFCGEPATSKEHVPPKCLFPESERINLITVRSCDKHNSKKSGEDEFLRNYLMCKVGNNQTGIDLAGEKGKRSLELTKFKALKETMEVHSVTQTDKGIFYTGRALEAGQNKALHCLEHIIKGLLYHETGKRYDGGATVIPTWFTHSPFNEAELKPVFDLIKREESSQNWKGNNPAVFKYFLRKETPEWKPILSMVFYENSRVHVILHESL